MSIESQKPSKWGAFQALNGDEAPTTSEPSGSSKWATFKAFDDQNQSADEPQQPQQADYDLPDDFADRLFDRGVANVYARGVEGFAGTPGNIASLANTVTGKKVPFLQKAARGLPTTEDLRGVSEKYGGGYLTPSSDIDKMAGEFMTDVASFAFPLGRIAQIPGTLGRAGSAVSRGINFLRQARPVVTPLIGQGAKQTAKALGADESTQEKVKLGSMILNDVLSARGTGSRGYINHLYHEATSSVPRGTLTNANTLQAALTEGRRTLMQGGTDATKTAALAKIEEMLARIHQNGNNYLIDPQEFHAARVSINQIVDSLRGWGSNLPTNIQRRAVRNMNNVRTNIIDAGMEYGQNANPRFGAYWQAANEASHIRSRSEFALNFAKKILPTKLFTKIFGSALAGTAIHAGAGAVVKGAVKSAVVGGPIALGVGAAHQAGKVAYRMWNSPNLRHYYGQLFQSAIAQDTQAVARYSDKISKEIEKSDKKEKDLIEEIRKK